MGTCFLAGGPSRRTLQRYSGLEVSSAWPPHLPGSAAGDDPPMENFFSRGVERAPGLLKYHVELWPCRQGVSPILRDSPSGSILLLQGRTLANFFLAILNTFCTIFEFVNVNFTL